MKLLMLFAALLVSVPAATAATIEPIGFAVTYCSLRDRGFGHNDAMEKSVVQNIDVNKPAIKLASGVDLDVRLGYLGARELCPQHLQ